MVRPRLVQTVLETGGDSIDVKIVHATQRVERACHQCVAHFVVNHAAKQILDHEVVNRAAPDDGLHLDLTQELLPRRSLQLGQSFEIAVKAVSTNHDIRLERRIFFDFSQLLSHQGIGVRIDTCGHR